MYVVHDNFMVSEHVKPQNLLTWNNMASVYECVASMYNMHVSTAITNDHMIQPSHMIHYK